AGGALGLAGAGYLLELAVRCAQGLEPGLGRLVNHAVDRRLQVVLLGEVGAGDGRDEPHRRADGVSAGVVAADGRVLAVLLLAHGVMAFRVRTVTGITIKPCRDRCHIFWQNYPIIGTIAAPVTHPRTKHEVNVIFCYTTIA